MNIYDTKVRFIKGVGQTREALLAKLGLSTAADLLGHFPYRYEDRNSFTKISLLIPGVSSCVRARVISGPVTRRISGGRSMTNVNISDDSASLKLTFFNMPYIHIEEGEIYDFYGKCELSGKKLTMFNPVFEAAGSASKVGRIWPVYHLTAGLNNAGFIRYIDEALKAVDDIQETLPDNIVERFSLLPIKEAYRQIHHPDNADSLELARYRFAFEELFFFSLKLSGIKNSRTMPGQIIPPANMTPFYSSLAFTPTNAQMKAIDEIITDMADGSTPAMRRMVQGDVGSGKTLVAAAAVYDVIKSGYQAAMMVPTEILAQQHFTDLSNMFSPLDIRVGILTSGMRAQERRETLRDLENGQINLIIGTHALISESTHFAALRLVITDEQHRFGVRQRTLLREKSDIIPHMLAMSATPIPRTLAMVIYGDMDLSVIDELPPGRIPVDTRAPDENKRNAVYGFMRRQLLSGRQAYVICPLIEEGEDDEMKAVDAFSKELKERYFPDFEVALLHGKLSNHEKDTIMERFASRQIKVLISTTVIEVGVNIPNANMIVIENAERFGLSQLHQLRGRVGRSVYKSYCVLMSSSTAPATRARLSVMCSSNDGFAIAREDLRLRGPGEFFGERQSGVPGMKLPQLGADMKLLALAEEAATDLIASDPQFSLPENEMIKIKLSAMSNNE